MPLQRPTLQQIIDRIRGDIRSGLGINTILRRTFLGVFSKALAGQSHVLHGNLEFVQKQLFPNTAEDEFLLQWGSVYGLEPKPATKAELNIKILGDEGSIIPDLTQWQNDQGSLYTQDGEATIPGPIVGVNEVTKVTTIADVAKSLAGQYFFLNSPLVEYVIYFRVDGTGTDPNLTGKTSIQVSIGENDTANDVAAAAQTIIDSATDLTATVLTNEITITNDDTGAVEDATDFNSGVTIIILTQGVTEVNVEAVIKIVADDGGANGNVDAGEFLTLVSAIAGVESQAAVTETILEGEDVESLEDFTVRLLTRIQEPPGSGNVNDYEQEALSVAGVTRAWVYPNIDGVGTGTVGVTFVEDGEDPIIPDAAKVAEVDDALNARDFKPVTAKVTTFAPTALSLDMTVKIKPNTQAVRDAVTTELNDLIFRDAQPKGAYESPETVFTGKLLLSKINESISRANGEDDHEITLINGGAPANVEPVSNGELIELGVIIWQPLA